MQKYDSAIQAHEDAKQELTEAVDVYSDAFHELDKFQARHNLY